MKKNTSDKRFSGILETFKTVLLVLLVIVLIVLVVIYISGMHIYEKMTSHDNAGSSFDRLWSVQGGAEPTGLDSARLMPEFIGYRQSGYTDARGCMADETALSELYRITSPCLLELFGSGAVCRELSFENGVKIFDTAKNGDEFVYIRYHIPVLYQMIYAYAAESLTVSAEDTAAGEAGNIGAYISELVIIPDPDHYDHGFVAYAYDGSGRYFEFRRDSYDTASAFYTARLADIGDGLGLPVFRFHDNDSFESAIPVIDGEIGYMAITVEDTVIKDEDTLNAVLKLFGYNPDKLDWYSDGDANVYIDSHSQLRIGPGELSFATSDGHVRTGDSLRGLGIDSLLGYTKDSRTTLFDKLTAADNLIRQLENTSDLLCADPASLCLGDVYSDGSLLVIEYFLTYNGIRISGEPYIRIELTDRTVSGVTLSLITLESDSDAIPALPQAYVMENLRVAGAVGTGDVIKALRLIYRDGAAEWVAEIVS